MSAYQSMSSRRLDQFQTQHELARNFYDDFDFCPVQCTEDAIEHRERIQQRISPHSSPRTSPTMGGYSVSHKLTPPSKRAIPIINPANMAPVSVPLNQPSSASFWQHRYHQQAGYHDVLVQ